MDFFVKALKDEGFQGECESDEATLAHYSHDASMFELKPRLVVHPKNTEDLVTLVKVVKKNRAHVPDLSITARSGGTDMSGGAIGQSVVTDFTRYFHNIGKVGKTAANVQPGVLYREFEKATLTQGALLPSFPASRELATVGGMVANNAGGEKSLRWGKTDDYVSQLEVVLADGQVTSLKALDRTELAAKQRLKSFEGDIYRQMFKLLDDNYEVIKAAKPKVSKNSTGYNLWDVWDRQTGTFDLTKLFVGSQGTLGLISNIDFKLVPASAHSGVLAVFMKNIDDLGEIINAVLEHRPESFEAFDNYTINFSIRFFPFFRKTLGWWGLIKLGLALLPDVLIFLKGIPKMILLVEFTGETPEEVARKVHALRSSLEHFKLEAMEEDSTEARAWKFRIIRRESFNLLRQKVHDKHTAPFIDDLVVPPAHLPEFLPKLRAIIKKYDLLATIAGHMGDGNFHVIPLMRIEDPHERAKLEPAMREVNELVLGFGGSLSGEHNDGLIRGPWLEQMYGKSVADLFRQTKKIFDPDNIFNPRKKTDANWDFSMSVLRKKF